MLTLRRLNMDTSWSLDWAGTTVLIDPWLVGSEVDGFSWFNEQWHATPPVSPENLGNYDSILISQCYSDHCHEDTLEALHQVPVITVPSAVKRVAKALSGRPMKALPEVTSGEWLQQGELYIAYLDPGKMIDPIYNGIVFRHAQECVVYFPHGFYLKPAQLEMLKQLHVRVLITSFSRFQLPFFLGGAVNPGMDNALDLIRQLNPDKVVHTHDENKHAKGLVKKIAKVVYPDPNALVKSLAGKFVYQQYEPIHY
jgi:hypothetical protein